MLFDKIKLGLATEYIIIVIARIVVTLYNGIFCSSQVHRIYQICFQEVNLLHPRLT